MKEKYQRGKRYAAERRRNPGRCPERYQGPQVGRRGPLYSGLAILAHGVHVRRKAEDACLRRVP